MHKDDVFKAEGRYTFFIPVDEGFKVSRLTEFSHLFSLTRNFPDHAIRLPSTRYPSSPLRSIYPWLGIYENRQDFYIIFSSFSYSLHIRSLFKDRVTIGGVQVRISKSGIYVKLNSLRSNIHDAESFL